jgi:putative heme-binding domain-containing protein
MKAWAVSFAGDFLKNLDTKPQEVKDLPTAHVDEAHEYFEEIARQQVFACQVASENKLRTYEPGLRALLSSNWAKNRPKSMAAKALLDINPNGNATLIENLLKNPQAELSLREELAKAIGNSAYAGRTGMLAAALKDAPTGLQVAIASVFVNSAQGRANLLQSTKEGTISPRILLDRRINEQLVANLTAAQQKEYQHLTGGIESVVEERQKLIEARLARFEPKPDLDQGKAIFVNNCNVCHQIDGQGGIIGPQLDGIGNWGRRALAEKILDPNRNISQAFKTYTITSRDGKVLSGLFRREEGQLEVYANASGQEFSVAKKDIKEKKASQFTLMPDSFGETISEEDFDDLIGYLLSQK